MTERTFAKALIQQLYDAVSDLLPGIGHLAIPADALANINDACAKAEQVYGCRPTRGWRQKAKTAARMLLPLAFIGLCATARADDYGARIMQEHQCRQYTALAKSVLLFKDRMHWPEARAQEWASSLAYGPGGVAYRESFVADAQLSAMVHEVYTGPWDVRNLGDYAFAHCMGYAR